MLMCARTVWFIEFVTEPLRIYIYVPMTLSINVLVIGLWEIEVFSAIAKESC